MTAALRVVAPGLNTTVQDRGRSGHQRFGVPVAGALDRLALAAANVVVGNLPDSAALECLYQGPTLEIAADSVRLAVAGHGAALEVLEPAAHKARRIAAGESVVALRGERVRVISSGASISSYLAIEGSIDVPLVLGSRSTYLRAGLGGFHGRALRTGDELPLNLPRAPDRAERRLPGLDLRPPETIRVALGPQHERFTPDAIDTLLSQSYRVEPSSDRMGLRLAGPRLAHATGADIVSDGIAPGAIQVPGNGQPIIMLADRQTTGGYTKIATVVSADLPGLGRLGPGARLRFEAVEVAVAEQLRRAQEQEIAAWQGRLQPVPPGGADLARLLEHNLISGVVDGGE